MGKKSIQAARLGMLFALPWFCPFVESMLVPVLGLMPAMKRDFPI